ncbi:MAG: DUF362 domain-containing protein [Candidatus Brocadiia bacterium]
MGEKEQNRTGDLTRRQFLIGGAVAAAGLGAARYVASRRSGLRIREFAENDLSDGMAIIHAAERDNDEQQTVRRMTRRAVEALGGMDKLVGNGDSVVIKPNMAWVRGPRFATNTNPWVVAALVEMCLEAGAGRVRVMGNTISKNPAPSYSTSGIADAARAAGAAVPYVDRSRAVELDIPDAFALERWPFCREFVDADECDVLINVPILKHHGTSRLTIGLKNAFGMIAGERGQLHRQIHHKMPDLHRVLRVDLTVMDAYRVLRTHGPTGGTLEDVDNSLEGARRVVACRDRVAIDAYGAHMFDLGPEEVGFIKNAAEAELGTADWQSLDLTEETV